MKFNYLVFVFIVFCMVSCGKDEDCIEESITTTSLEDEYSCENTSNLVEIDLNNQYTIIKEQALFDTLVSGPCMPQIDFATYDLIIGKQGLTSGNTSIEYEMERDCNPLVYNLKVIFNQNETTVAPNLTYHVLVPKLEESSTVQVTIEEKF